MNGRISGLHHVTAISGPAQQNVDFYVGVLRQRLVKKTVNFDDPGTYHLYYGDRTGSPGTIMTFFPFADAGRGRAGPGMATALAYAVAQGTLDAWMRRLTGSGIDFQGPAERFDERMISLRDPDGLQIELIEHPPVARQSAGADDTVALMGLHSVSLCLESIDRSARVLTDLFGYESAGEEADGTGQRLRFRSPSGAAGSMIDLRIQPERAPGRPGAGTIHHIAFRAKDDEEQFAWRDKLASAGLQPTAILDRNYFRSIYFREPGGVLFEIATDQPGFLADEPEAELGTQLKLPRQYEPMRQAIERHLPPIHVPEGR